MPKLQKAISTEIDLDAVASYRNALQDIKDKARIQSISAKGTSAWLQATDESSFAWFSNVEFRTAMSLRLGLEVSPSALPCVECVSVICDRFGHHSLACHRGGQKTIVHNAVRDKLAELASTALLHARREDHPFPDDSNLRMDISLHAGFAGVVQLLYVGVCSPFADGNVHGAAEVAGGATASLEAAKRRKYGPPLERAGMQATHVFTPILCDSFGAWNAASQPVLAAIPSAYASRLRAGGRYGRHSFFATMNATVVRGSARQVLRQAGAHLQE